MNIFAHRGSSGTYPENTLVAFKEVARLPVAGVELDVHLTKDEQVVVIHDDSINRTSNGKGLIKEMTLAELKTYDFGSWFSKKFINEKIPTLEEVLTLFSTTSHHINIELKYKGDVDNHLVEHVLSLVSSLQLEERVIISSFNHKALQKSKEVDPSVQTALLSKKMIKNPISYMMSIGTDAIHLSIAATSHPLTKKIIDAGYTVRVYTVNDKKDLKKLKKIGVHAIITDYPKHFHTLLNKWSFFSLFKRKPD